jgi:hypothetical protein
VKGEIVPEGVLAKDGKFQRKSFQGRCFVESFRFNQWQVDEVFVLQLKMGKSEEVRCCTWKEVSGEMW